MSCWPWQNPLPKPEKIWQDTYTRPNYGSMLSSSLQGGVPMFKSNKGTVWQNMLKFKLLPETVWHEWMRFDSPSLCHHCMLGHTSDDTKALLQEGYHHLICEKHNGIKISIAQTAWDLGVVYGTLRACFLNIHKSAWEAHATPDLHHSSHSPWTLWTCQLPVWVYLMTLSLLPH